MKILYIYQYFKFPDERGGARAYDLATSFSKKGYDVTILALTANKEYKNKKKWNSVRKDGIEVQFIYLPYENSMSYFQRSWVFFKFLWFTSWRALKIDCDFALASSTPLTIGVPALIKKWIHKTPFIFEVRDVWPEAVIDIGAIKNKGVQKLLYWLEKIIYKN